MKAFITGVGGFVGSYLAKELLAQGHTVSGCDRIEKNIDNVKTYAVDILDVDKLKEVFAAEKPDWVFHLAGQSSVSISFDEPKLTKDINVTGTENLLSVAGDARVLIVSSAEVYGTPESLPVTEESPIQAGSPYAESRVEQEKVALASGRDVVIVRSFNHSGPGQPDKFVLPYLAKQLAEVKKFKRDTILLGNPHTQRDFSDVRDIVRAYVLALEKGEKGEIYNLCSGNAYHLGKLAVQVGKEIGRDVEVVKDPKFNRPNDILKLYGSHKKFSKVTGWKPEISIVKTLLDMVDTW
tara:strand:- start:1969 stop:2853 length:885 start_codon:yes stop_codon:yes gene_type:complete